MQQKLKLGMLSYVHFFVDFACAFWVNSMILHNGTKHIPALVCYDSRASVPDGTSFFWLILYNFLAFTLQLPLGMLCDRLHQKRPWWMAALGCALIGLAGVVAFVAGEVSPEALYMQNEMLTMSILLGLGNAFFHVGAGVRVLQMGERMTPVGIFVSTGAFGICLGGLFSRNLSPTFYEYRLFIFSVLIILLSFAAAVLLLLGSKMDSCQISVHKNGQKNREENAGIIFLLFLVVALRSFQGSILNFSWNTGTLIPLIFALCIVAGKALGGILADWFGVPLATLPLLFSALLFLWSENNMFFGLAAVLLFQTSMPITLSLMHKQMPALPGTAFGLLSFALFVGYFPKFMHRYYWTNVPWHYPVYIYSIVTGISFILLVLLLGLWYRNRVEEPMA